MNNITKLKLQDEKTETIRLKDWTFNIRLKVSHLTEGIHLTESIILQDSKQHKLERSVSNNRGKPSKSNKLIISSW